MMLANDAQIQLVDLPSTDRDILEPEMLDLVRRSDMILLVVDLQADPLRQLESTVAVLDANRIAPLHRRSRYPTDSPLVFIPLVVVANKCDNESMEESCQIFCELLEGEWPVLSVSALNGRNFESLKQIVFDGLDIIRVYSKAPGQEVDYSAPFVMKRGGTVAGVRRQNPQGIRREIEVRQSVGRHGPQIYCTRPTADLVPVMLKDSAHVQTRGVRRDRSGRRRLADEAPLYTAEDVDRLTTRLIGVPYGVEFSPHPSVRLRLQSAGHIVGAAFAEIHITEGRHQRTLVVSGDIGEASPLVVRDRDPLRDADVLVLESTYGDRNHRSMDETEVELIDVIRDVLHVRHGNVIVPIWGGVAFTIEYDTQLFFRRAKELQLSWCDVPYLEELIAADVLDR